MFHIRELKENNISVYLAILKLSKNFLHPSRNFYHYYFGYLYKIWKKGTSCREKWLLSGSLQLPIREMDIYENLRRITSQCTLLYLNSARIFCTLQELFITIILDIYIKFRKKGRLVEKSGC